MAFQEPRDNRTTKHQNDTREIYRLIGNRKRKKIICNKIQSLCRSVSQTVTSFHQRPGKAQVMFCCTCDNTVDVLLLKLDVEKKS